MTHPYLDRRQGRAAVTYPHPSLEPVLKRTLGVPLFQEQLLRIAMVAAGFSGGEAEELRRAMGFKRSRERMVGIEKKLRAGMARKGIKPKAQEEIVKAITSFALYGFPESHSASFALIVYASAYLKCHHPTAFYASLLNAWPMGFYNPATLVKDAQRHGVEVRPIDVEQSRWDCDLEPVASGGAGSTCLALRSAALTLDTPRPQGSHVQAEMQRNFEFLSRLPNTAARFTENAIRPGGDSKRLILDHDNYYAMTGGHGACRGCICDIRER